MDELEALKAKHAAEMEERTTLEEELETLRAEHRLVYKKSEIGPADAAVALVGPFSHAMSADIMVIDCDSTLYAVAKRERDSMRKENATLTQKLQLAEIEKLQRENAALREENQALQKREARLIEHNSQVQSSFIACLTDFSLRGLFS